MDSRPGKYSCELSAVSGHLGNAVLSLQLARPMIGLLTIARGYVLSDSPPEHLHRNQTCGDQYQTSVPRLGRASKVSVF